MSAVRIVVADLSNPLGSHVDPPLALLGRYDDLYPSIPRIRPAPHVTTSLEGGTREPPSPRGLKAV